MLLNTGKIPGLSKTKNVLKDVRAWIPCKDGLVKYHTSTTEIFARQGTRGGYGRLDIASALLAIRDRDRGLRVFKRLVEIEPERERADRALLEVLERGSLIDALYVAHPVLIDVSGRLHSSVATLALALHRNESHIPTQVSGSNAHLIHDRNWFLANGFSGDDVALLEATVEEVYDDLGFARMPWTDIVQAQDVMRSFLDEKEMMHGRGGFYQSCEELLIDGQRPTKARFHQYGLKGMLSPQAKVLDIGCNNGFFSILVSRHAGFVDGFDINPRFIRIAEHCRKVLGRENCNFSVCSFEGFNGRGPYDIILSFAVHHWIGLPIEQYARKLQKLLKPGGHVLLESQDLATHDKDWEQKLTEFCSTGFQEVHSGTLCDDGLLTRRFVLLRDERTP